jgi:hypothetical protein
MFALPPTLMKTFSAVRSSSPTLVWLADSKRACPL